MDEQHFFRQHDEIAPSTLSGAGSPVKLTLTQQLDVERRRLVQRIAEIDELRAALDATPGIQRVVDLIFKQGLR